MQGLRIENWKKAEHFVILENSKFLKFGSIVEDPACSVDMNITSKHIKEMFAYISESSTIVNKHAVFLCIDGCSSTSSSGGHQVDGWPPSASSRASR